MDKLNGEDCTICRAATNAPEFKQVGGMDKLEKEVTQILINVWKERTSITEATSQIRQLYKLKLPENPYPDYPRFTAQSEAYEYALQQVKEKNPHLEVE